MSTFDSVVNAAASYWVKDIYQGLMRPNASEEDLKRHGRIATVGVAAAGVDTLVEIGPGNVLSGLAKRSMRGVTSHQLANAGDLGL